MNAFSRFGPAPHHPWLYFSLALFFLTGCATTGPAEEKSSDAETVDIGYGTVDKEHQVGSVSTLDTQKLQADRSRSLAEMLAPRLY